MPIRCIVFSAREGLGYSLVLGLVWRQKDGNAFQSQDRIFFASGKTSGRILQGTSVTEILPGGACARSLNLAVRL
jgi:hypothetical protein